MQRNRDRGGMRQVANLKDSSQRYASVTTGYLSRGSKRTDGTNRVNAVEGLGHMDGAA